MSATKQKGANITSKMPRRTFANSTLRDVVKLRSAASQANRFFVSNFIDLDTSSNIRTSIFDDSANGAISAMSIIITSGTARH